MSGTIPSSDHPGPPGRIERFLHPLGRMSIGDERLSLILQALAVALLFTWLKWIVHEVSFEPVETLPLISAILGGVVFTLAMLLAATLQDYKESERIVGELSSSLRRLHWDFTLIRPDSKLVRDADAVILQLVRQLREDLRKGASLTMAAIHPLIASLDVLLQQLTEGGRTPVVRTAQTSIGSILRVIERIEIIVETTFTRAGYYFAGFVTFGAIVALCLTRIEPFNQGLILFGFAAFLLVGLFLLIWDLDNPFSGHARISLFQLDELERTYAGLVEAPRVTATVAVTP